MDNWIGEAVGKMHLHKVKQEEVAEKMGIRRDYFNKIINGKEAPKGVEERVNSAIDSIIEKRKSNNPKVR